MKKPSSPRHDAKSAAQFLTETLGSPVSHRSIARYSIPYRVVLGRRIYEERDLAVFAETQFAAAPRRMPDRNAKAAGPRAPRVKKTAQTGAQIHGGE